MYILTCPSNVPVLHQNNMASVTLEDFEDEQSNLFKLKAKQRGKLNGSEIPLDPQLFQSAPLLAPEEPRDDYPELRLQPRPIMRHTVTPTLPNSEELCDDNEPELRLQLHPCLSPITPTLPEESQDDGQSNQYTPSPPPTSGSPC
jgi:hypothetical protein